MDSGSLDLSAELGTTSANITMTLGHNELISGAGNDYLTTGDGNDSVYGGGGDTFELAATQFAKVAIFGGAGDDEIVFQLGTGEMHGLTLDASQSIERVSGYLMGTAKADVFDLSMVTAGLGFSCNGAAGDELIIAQGSGDCYLFGGDGDDTIYARGLGSYIGGGRGRDVLYGSIGDDHIDIDMSDVLVSGGGGSDVLRSGGEGRGVCEWRFRQAYPDDKHDILSYAQIFRTA